MGVGLRVTRKKITRLLEELRSWDLDTIRPTLRSLGARFRLAPEVVDRLARSEGYLLPIGEEPDEDDTTLVGSVAAVKDALREPESVPDTFEDMRTPKWQRLPTGEWEPVKEEMEAALPPLPVWGSGPHEDEGADTGVYSKDPPLEEDADTGVFSKDPEPTPIWKKDRKTGDWEQVEEEEVEEEVEEEEESDGEVR